MPFIRLGLIAALLALATEPLAARDSATLHACYSSPALAAIAGEEIPVKGNHAYDKPLKLDGLQAAQPVPDGLRGAIRRVALPPGRKVIALTFDLCEQRGEVAGYDGRIIDYLRQQGIKATLFAGGKWMTSHPARTEQLMLDPLFEIGNHTETHANLRLLQDSAVRREILMPQKAYEIARARLAGNQCLAAAPSALGDVPDQPRVFRFPYGACNEAALKAVNDAGMLAIQWDLATGDPSPQMSATAIADAMVRDAKPGSIIVNHANGKGWHTAEALPIAIPKLKAKGYKFVTVSELLSMGKPEIVSECYDRKPGDTNRYDFLSNLHHPLNPTAAAGPFASTPLRSKAPDSGEAPN